MVKGYLEPMKRRVILPAIGHTIGGEQTYARELTKIVAEGVRFARDEIAPLVLIRDSLTRDGRFDDVFRRLRDLMDIVSDAARRLLDRLLRFENANNERRLNEALRRTLGIDITAVIGREGIERVIEDAVTRNVSLIRGLAGDTATRIEQSVLDAATQGATSRDLSDRLMREFDVGQRRSRLIARDQLGKFSAQLNETRQRGLGVEEYIWSCSLDERVRGNPDGRYPNARPSHWDREGQTFRWDSPPQGGHPGEAIQCRCVARAVLEATQPIGRNRPAFEAAEV
jgi:SPP1 gp7 family putative phage head morphogenesis protein